jgi:hypothetical protein
VASRNSGSAYAGRFSVKWLQPQANMKQREKSLLAGGSDGETPQEIKKETHAATGSGYGRHSERHHRAHFVLGTTINCLTFHIHGIQTTPRDMQGTLLRKTQLPLLSPFQAWQSWQVFYGLNRGLTQFRNNQENNKPRTKQNKMCDVCRNRGGRRI